MERISHVWQFIGTQIKLKTCKESSWLFQMTKTSLTHGSHLSHSTCILDDYLYCIPDSTFSLQLLTFWNQEIKRKDKLITRRTQHMKYHNSSFSFCPSYSTTYHSGLLHPLTSYHFTSCTFWVHEHSTWDSAASLSSNQWHPRFTSQSQNSLSIFQNPTLLIWTNTNKTHFTFDYYI